MAIYSEQVKKAKGALSLLLPLWVSGLACLWPLQDNKLTITMLHHESSLLSLPYPMILSLIEVSMVPTPRIAAV